MSPSPDRLTPTSAEYQPRRDHLFMVLADVNRIIGFSLAQHPGASPIGLFIEKEEDESGVKFCIHPAVLQGETVSAIAGNNFSLMVPFDQQNNTINWPTFRITRYTPFEFNPARDIARVLLDHKGPDYAFLSFRQYFQDLKSRELSNNGPHPAAVLIESGLFSNILIPIDLRSDYSEYKSRAKTLRSGLMTAGGLTMKDVAELRDKLPS